jgi:hypothetical protein
MSEDPEFRPATRVFEFDAASLGIPGVGFVSIENFSPATGDPWLEAHGTANLELLRERLAGSYSIVDGMW